MPGSTYAWMFSGINNNQKSVTPSCHNNRRHCITSLREMVIFAVGSELLIYQFPFLLNAFLAHYSDPQVPGATEMHFSWFPSGRQIGQKVVCRGYGISRSTCHAMTRALINLQRGFCPLGSSLTARIAAASNSISRLKGGCPSLYAGTTIPVARKIVGAISIHWISSAMTCHHF